MRTGTSTSASRSSRATASPNPPTMPLSSTVTTSRCCAAAPASASSTGLTQRGSTTVTPMPWPASRSATSTATAAIGPARDQQHVGVPARRAGSASTSMPPSAADRRDVRLRRLPRGNLSAVGPSLTATHSRSSSVSLVPSRGTATFMPGTICSDRAVPHAVVAGAVRTGDPGPVEHEGDRQLVHGHVHQHLVEGPVQERRVDRDDRVHAAHRQAGGAGHRVLLGDADVEDPVRVGLGERREAGRVQHRGGDRDHVGPAGADRGHLVGEDLGVRPFA